MTTTRKGWAPLSSFAKVYVGPDGTDYPIHSYEDLDRVLAAWGEVPAGTDEDSGQAAPDMSPEAVEARAIAKRRQAEALAFVASYTGTFGLILDIRADRRFGSKHMRLSTKQVDAILKSRDRDIARAEANQIDRELYADDQYRSSQSTRPEAPGLAPQRPAGPAMGSPAEGMYRLPDGTIIKVQRALKGGQHLYGKRLIVGDGAGTFEYERGLLSRVRPQYRMTVDEAAEFGKLYGWCCVCGRRLTNEDSIANGIGPICASKV